MVCSLRSRCLYYIFTYCYNNSVNCNIWHSKNIQKMLFEKRKQIKIGDTIKFSKVPDLNESFNAKVIELLRYNSFENMFKDFDISILSDKSMTKEELITVLEQFYPKEKQEQYGVLGIRIELL